MNPPKHIVSAAGIVIRDDNQLLLIRGPERGWEMPGGQVEEGESVWQAAIRETREESGVEIEIIRFCGIFQNVNQSICNALFLARPIGGQLTTSEESLEVAYFPIQEGLKKVNYMNFRQRIEHCLDQNKQPFYIDF